MPLLIALAVPVVLLLAYAASRPGAFRIARSKLVDAPPEAVFAVIDDFHRWAAWSPWDKMDPTMTRTYEGAERGVGAVYRWKGDGKVGEGSMAITESVPNSLVAIDLAFLKPIAANNKTSFTLTPEGEGTRVEWAMEGVNAFPAKLFGVFMDMDKMVGADFERGLAAMGDAARAPR